MKHPGTIVIVDEDARTEKKLAAVDVPDSIAFVDGVPVVRVVSRKRGVERELLAYGADGALLQTTLAQ